MTALDTRLPLDRITIPLVATVHEDVAPAPLPAVVPPKPSMADSVSTGLNVVKKQALALVNVPGHIAALDKQLQSFGKKIHDNYGGGADIALFAGAAGTAVYAGSVAIHGAMVALGPALASADPDVLGFTKFFAAVAGGATVIASWINGRFVDGPIRGALEGAMCSIAPLVAGEVLGHAIGSGLTGGNWFGFAGMAAGAALFISGVDKRGGK